MKLHLVVFFISLTIAFCQKPCTAPKQFQAHISGHDYVSRASVNATVSYDAGKQRQRVIENVWINGTVLEFDTLFLGDSKVVYRYDAQSKVCDKSTLTEPWKDLGLPADATFVSKQVIGSESVKDGSIKVNLWKYDFSDGKGNSVVSFESWTEVGCLPVDFTHFSKKANINMIKRFFDITLGIDNESVWEVRSECLNA